MILTFSLRDFFRPYLKTELGSYMKMTNGKTHELAPLYMEANTAQKKELLKKYGIGKTTFYAALKRYHMSIVKMLA